MIKLSDYLDYLNKEIIQARKLADENAIRVAKEYAQHSYLKYFKVPRYNIPVVKMDIPIKVANIDADKKYDFKYDEKLFLKDVNAKILKINTEKNLNIVPLTEKQIQTKDFTSIVKSLETKDQKFGKDFTVDVKKIDFLPKLNALNPNIFSPQDATDSEKTELKNIVSEMLANRYSLVNAKLNNLYIDPDTTSSEDKDKIFINLHVEMEEEGIRLVVLQDGNGNTVEEITFE